MQKRVGIARAIVLNPLYLFCDEPNSGLDPQTSITIDELIADITKDNNITTIINTHDMNSVMEIGENICLIDKGYLSWSGSKDQVLSSEDEHLHDFIFASPFLQKLIDGYNAPH
jgi:phospholipid/cholesterol/gamma-HCH transport system ATP-binding protein